MVTAVYPVSQPSELVGAHHPLPYSVYLKTAGYQDFRLPDFAELSGFFWNFEVSWNFWFSRFSHRFSENSDFRQFLGFHYYFRVWFTSFETYKNICETGSRFRGLDGDLLESDISRENKISRVFSFFFHFSGISWFSVIFMFPVFNI